MTRNIILILVFIGVYSDTLTASKIIVSESIGFNQFDSSSFLQYAFTETTEDSIIVDNVGMIWNTGPLLIERNDVTIIFEEGVILRALFGEFDVFESLLRINARNNIRIIGYKANLEMNKQEYIDLADSEFRHGISLNSATNIVIEGLSISDTGGDGILLTRNFQPNSQQNYCENVLIKNCTFTNNYRQGISVTSAKDLTIINCEFSETNGTLPEDGIDLEPDIPEERLENILIKDCRIFNNYGNAIQLALFMMNDNSIDVSITVEDTYMSNNHHPSNTFDFAEIAVTDNGSNGVDGFVHFKNCYISSSQWTAVYAQKTIESFDLNFTNCVFKDVSNDPIALNNPIFLEVTDYFNPVPRFGGMNFTDCTIIYNENIPFFNGVENLSTSDGMGNISGNFYIINPNDTGYYIGENPENVDISYEYFESIPESEIGLTANQLNYLEEDQFIKFEISRTGNIDVPIAVELEYSGTAEYGIDFNRGNGFVVMPSMWTTFTDSIQIIQDLIQESTESLLVTSIENDCVLFSQDSILQFSIDDMITSLIPENTLDQPDVMLFPNPANGTVYIETKSNNFDVDILNHNGQIIKSQTNQILTTSIDLHQLNAGGYMVRIKDAMKNETQVYKLIKY